MTFTEAALASQQRTAENYPKCSDYPIWRWMGCESYEEALLKIKNITK